MRVTGLFAESDRFKVWVNGTLQINVTNSTFLTGGVAFGGPFAVFDNCKIAYDTPRDQGGSAESDDIDDPTDGERSEREHSATGKASKMRASGMRTRPQ